MRRSGRRILTTHTGSLPRPRDLVAMLRDREEGRADDTVSVKDHLTGFDGESATPSSRT